MSIPVLKPSPTVLEERLVVEAVRSGWWGNGPRCREVEALLAEAYDRRHAVTTNSATAALHLACIAAGIGEGDEVILPALTFVSTALAVRYCGAHPVFADVKPDTLTLDWRDVQMKISDRTKAIISVDYAGYPAFLERPATDVIIIQDAAHAPLGVGYGDFICLSFHPVKPIASPDGGAVILDNDAAAARIRRLAWCGIDRDTWQRATGGKYAWRYNVREIGYKCHWNDIAASLALAQLRCHSELLRRRRELAHRYLAALGGYPIQLPVVQRRHQWHLFAVRVAPEERDRFIEHMAQCGVSCSVHYEPLTHYEIFAQETPPVTEREWRRLVTLPLYSDMTKAEQDVVIRGVEVFYG